MPLRFRKPRFHRLWSMLLCAILLTACAARDQATPREKVGMHIDAELEFVIDYPLDWRKERRIPWRGSTGSVIWTLPGAGTQDYFEVALLPLQQSAVPLDERWSRLRDRYPGLTVSSQQEVELPAGAALQVTGSTPQANFAAYLLRGSKRDYFLILYAAAEKFERFSATLEEMLESFRILADEP